MELSKIILIAMAITGILNCFVAATFLFFLKRGNLKANIFLGFLSIAIGFKICFALLFYVPHESNIFTDITFLLSQAGYLLFGSLLFFYFRALLNKKISPAIIILCLLPGALPFANYFLQFGIHLWLMQSIFLTFLIIIFFELKSFLRNEQKINRLKSEVKWIKTLYAFFCFIWIIVNILAINFKLFFFELSVIFTTTFYIMLSLAFKYYWQKKGDENQVNKYNSSRLTIQEENDILNGVKQMMETEKVYIDSEISLPRVAAKMEVSPHKLSYVINKKAGMTFNEFINSYRVQDIKSAIISPETQHLKIASIAYDHGFNSISVFNTTFKKFTNCTPSQYRSENLLEQQN